MSGHLSHNVYITNYKVACYYLRITIVTAQNMISFIWQVVEIVANYNVSL